MKEIDIIFSPTFIASKFNILASMRICVSPIPRAICSIVVAVALYGIQWGWKWETSFSFHGIVEEDKGLEFSFEGLRYPPPINIEDVQVNPLHMIFDLKGVFVGKEYFRINHMLPLSYNITWSHTLLDKRVVSRLGLKEFLFRCLD